MFFQRVSGRGCDIISHYWSTCQSSVGRAVTDITTETSRVVAQVVQPAVAIGNGDKNCEFILSTVQEFYVTLECCHHLGNVLGSLPSGDITDSLQTTKDSDVSQFAPHIIASDYIT